MIWIIWVIAFAAEEVTWYSDSFSGVCGKTQSVYVKVDLPRQPLLYLSVKITLDDLDGELSEYPKPKPEAFGRIDGVPNEKYYDYYANLESKSGNLVSKKFPKNGEFVIIRIDGGLLNELHFFNAYSVHGWDYKIYLSAAYCPSGLFTILPWVYKTFTKYCDIPVGEVKEDYTGYVGKMIYVPTSIEQLKIHSNSDYTINLNNFADGLKIGSFDIKFPTQGWWFILSNQTNTSSLTISQEPCLISNISTCLNETIVFISHTPTYTNLRSTLSPSLSSNTSILHLSVPILEEDLKYRYALLLSNINPKLFHLSYSFNGINNQTVLCDEHNKKNYCKLFKNKILTEVEYPILGNLMIHIQNDIENFTYGVTLLRTRIGDNMCNDQRYVNYDGIVYYCLCFQNTAGFYCEKHAISDAKYMTGIMFLTLSNFTMLLALIYGYKIRAYIEVTAYCANMLASYIYHWCDEQYFCFGFSPYALRTIDFILSFYSVCVSIVYLAKLPLLSVKFTILLGVIVVLLYLGLGTGFSAFESSIMVRFMKPLIIIGLFTTARYTIFVVKSSKRVYGKFRFKAFLVFFKESGNFRLKWLGLALLCLTSALISKAFELNYNYYIVRFT